jgi:hypothetical protein
MYILKSKSSWFLPFEEGKKIRLPYLRSYHLIDEKNVKMMIDYVVLLSDYNRFYGNLGLHTRYWKIWHRQEIHIIENSVDGELLICPWIS